MFIDAITAHSSSFFRSHFPLACISFRIKIIAKAKQKKATNTRKNTRNCFAFFFLLCPFTAVVRCDEAHRPYSKACNSVINHFYANVTISRLSNGAGERVDARLHGAHGRRSREDGEENQRNKKNARVLLEIEQDI